MLNFIISTIAFSIAAYALNSYFDAKNINILGTRSRAWIVMIGATLISIGAGWAMYELDGEAEMHKNDSSIVDEIQTGDSLKIAKLFAGFN